MTPIQAGISDHYCRKKSLIFGFTALAIGHIFLYFSLTWNSLFLVPCFMFNGLLGNVHPIATAALLDGRVFKATRTSLSLVAIMVAFGWCLYQFIESLSGPIVVLWIVTFLCLFCAILAALYFEDLRDRDKHTSHFKVFKEILTFRSFFDKKWFYFFIKGYLITEIAWYLMYYYDIDERFSISTSFIIYTFTIGYIFGVIFQYVSKLKIFNSMKAGLTLSMSCILITNMIVKMDLSIGYLNVLLYFIFSFGYGLLDPVLYTSISLSSGIHKQGKLFGIFESVDNLAELICIGFLIIETNASTSLILMIALLLSWLGLAIFYHGISYHKKNVRLHGLDKLDMKF